MTPQAMKDPAANPAVFDRNGEFTTGIKLAKKSVTVRFPTDEQLSRRQAMIRITFKRFGQTGTTTEIDGEDAANSELLSRIKISGDELDEAEAGSVIERILRADAEEPTREGEEYVIPIKVAGGIRTVHRLRIPTEKEQRKFATASSVTINGRHGSELKSFPAVYGTFYDKLAGASEGYAGEIPVCHKMVAVNELLAITKRAETEDDPELFS